ncbi:MAG TPA: sigma-54 dependent transcriptional regulator [Candidatus Binataceae bacterium]|nr:sigma-54 dependent transcriptional regulator [Candidatus Binataceae bacterium]
MSESLSAIAVEAYRGRVLLVESDESATRFIVKALEDEGYETELCPSGDAALTLIEQGCEVIVASVRGPGLDGLELLRRVRARRPDVAVILLAADNSVSAAVTAMREGAFDYVTQPFSADSLVKIVARAIEMGSLQRENRRLKQQLDVASTAAGFIAESPQSKQLVAMVRRVAPSRSTALIEGESGTGKELIARMLHYWSQRADGPFVAVNCKAFAEGVVESELFGHEKGSFTGAIAARAGCFERASGGTLFLDEIAEAGTDFQAKLLRVLEDGEVLRVGASKSRKVDVRIVAATNRMLRNEVAAGRFRADLYFRLNVIPVKIAPLRERREDIIPLARHFLAFYTAHAGRPITLSPEAERALLAYPWPGNVRELENVIERSVVMSGAEVLTPDAFALEGNIERAPESEDAPEPNETLQAYLDRAAVSRIRAALEAANGNRAIAATTLGVDRTTLYRLMKRLGL